MSAKLSESDSICSRSAQKSNKEDYDIQTIEKHIQNLLNLLIKGLQKLDIDEKIFDKFQNVFYSSDSLEEYLDGLYEMLKVLVSSMELRLKLPQSPSNQESPSGKGLAIERNADESTLQHNKVLSDTNYENLEKVLQRYEAEIREHIRIEQQLKIYSDGLEEKLAEKDAEMLEKTREMRSQVDQLSEEKAKLSKLLYDTKFEKIFLEKKLKQKKGNSVFAGKDARDQSVRKVGVTRKRRRRRA